MVKKKRGRRTVLGLDKPTLYVMFGVLLGLLVISVYFLVQEERVPLYAPGTEYIVWFDIDGNGIIEESDKDIIDEAFRGEGADSATINENIYWEVVVNKRCGYDEECDDNFDFESNMFANSALTRIVFLLLPLPLMTFASLFPVFVSVGNLPISFFFLPLNETYLPPEDFLFDLNCETTMRSLVNVSLLKVSIIISFK